MLGKKFKTWLGMYSPEYKIGWTNFRAANLVTDETLRQSMLIDAETAFSKVTPRFESYYAAQFRLACCKVALKKFDEADEIIKIFETAKGQNQIGGGKKQIPQHMLTDLNIWLAAERKK